MTTCPRCNGPAPSADHGGHRWWGCVEYLSARIDALESARRGTGRDVRNDRGCGGEQPDLTVRQYEEGWIRTGGRVWCSGDCQHAQRCTRGNAAPAPPAPAESHKRSCQFHDDCDDMDRRIGTRHGALKHPPVAAAPSVVAVPTSCVVCGLAERGCPACRDAGRCAERRPVNAAGDEEDAIRYEIRPDKVTGEPLYVRQPAATPAPTCDYRIAEGGPVWQCRLASGHPGIHEVAAPPTDPTPSVATPSGAVAPVTAEEAHDLLSRLYRQRADWYGPDGIEPRLRQYIRERSEVEAALRKERDEARYQATLYVNDLVTMRGDLNEWADQAQKSDAMYVERGREIDALRAELAEAKGDAEFAIARNKELLAETEAIRAEREEYIRERVDIGNKYDLHMADCRRELARITGDREQLRAMLSKCDRCEGTGEMPTEYVEAHPVGPTSCMDCCGTGYRPGDKAERDAPAGAGTRNHSGCNLFGDQCSSMCPGQAPAGTNRELAKAVDGNLASIRMHNASRDERVEVIKEALDEAEARGRCAERRDAALGAIPEVAAWRALDSKLRREILTVLKYRGEHYLTVRRVLKALSAKETRTL